MSRGSAFGRDTAFAPAGSLVPAGSGPHAMEFAKSPAGPDPPKFPFHGNLRTSRTSSLNAIDGAITSNMAITPTQNGSISAYALNPAHLVLDIFGYFAP